jgi:hypothetical protein
MNTATNHRQLQIAADLCTIAFGMDRTASIIDAAANLNLDDAALVAALRAGSVPAPASALSSKSAQSLLRAARLTDMERALVDAKIASGEVNTPAELRAYLQDLARARVAARTAKLAPLPASELADVAALSGNLARAERAALIQERDNAIHIGAEIPAPKTQAAPVEEIPAVEPDPAVIPNNDNLDADPDPTLDLPAPDFHVPASRPDLEIYRPSYPALPGQPAQAKSGKLARAKNVLAEAEKKAASKGLAERRVVVAGDIAWVESSKGDATYRVELEDGVPVFCSCRDPRAVFGGCKHGDAAHECYAQGDGTYSGHIARKPNPKATYLQDLR